MNASARIRIGVNESGRGSVLINEFDISEFTTAIEFAAGGDRLTQVKITLMADVDADVSARLEQIVIAKKEETQPGGVRLLDGRVMPVRRATK